MTTLMDCRLAQLPRVPRPQGNITSIEGNRDIPFPIERVHYLYDIPGGETRGGHAHRELQQLLVSVMGSFDVVLDDGNTCQTVSLNRAYLGLYIPSMIWRELVNFSSGGICLVLASLPYDEGEYVRDYQLFRRLKLDERVWS